MSSSASFDPVFGAVDALVFAGSLILAVGLGVYYAIKDRKRKSVDQYYYGGRNMSPIAVGLSCSVTFISALTVIGFPTEAYVYGMVTVWFAFTNVAPSVVASAYYIPMFHRLRLTTLYEYLELRFSARIRKITSLLEVVSSVAYLGIITYLPSLALEVISPLNLTWSILLTSGICTFYTAIGGMKAVIWTDVTQFVVMLFGALAALILAVSAVGGLDDVFAALERGGRMNVFDFDPNPCLRSTFWTIMIGNGLQQARLACTNQAIVQRYLSCKTVRGAQVAAMVGIIPKITLSTIVVLLGGVAYAYFEGCDPVKSSGGVMKPDQIIPLLVVNVFRDVPGMAGLFVAAAYSGTLSTVSSGINAVSSLLLQDFIVFRFPNLTSATKIKIGYATGIAIGGLVTATALVASSISGTAVGFFFAIDASFAGPVLGLFTLGLMLPWTNELGALAGLIVGPVLTGWMAIGGLFSEKDPAHQRILSTSTAGCTPVVSNQTTFGSTLAPPSEPSTSSVAQEKNYFPLYAVSTLYYGAVGLVLTVFIGICVSLATGPNEPKNMDPDLFCALVDNSRLPPRVRKFFRFGVPEPEEKVFPSSDVQLENRKFLTRETSAENYATADTEGNTK